MTTPMQSTTAASAPMSSVLDEAINTLRRAARSIDSWLAARKRIAADRDALANMSDRELFDIGLDRASVDFCATGGQVRDWPF